LCRLCNGSFKKAAYSRYIHETYQGKRAVMNEGTRLWGQLSRDQ
jgi:hypothetical protein